MLSVGTRGRLGALAAGGILLAFLSVLWIGMRMPMTHEAGHAMPFDCPFMQGGSLCRMTFDEHLALWKRLTNVPVSAGLGAALAGALAVLVISRFWSSQKESFACALPVLYDRWRGYIWKLGNWLSLAFSQGILHPKIW